MKKLLILSGKGGTGKTTTASAFIAFSKAKAFADCDVDAPNLHLISNLHSNFEKSPYRGSQKAVINPISCTNCGQCQSFCHFEAVQIHGTHYSINEFACEGCGVCMYICPENAISMQDDIAGELLLNKNETVFSSAKLKMGRGNSGKLVTEVKNNLYRNSKADLCIIDGSPGIGCPVIASISGVDLILIVTEPSLSGISDMKRILKTASTFGIKTIVCINKADICLENTTDIKTYCQDHNITYVGEIPYDNHVSKAINAGQNIASVDCPARDALKTVFEKTFDFLRRNYYE